jgi:hypothetical protein
MVYANNRTRTDFFKIAYNVWCYEQYSLAVFFKVTRKYLAVLLIGAVMPRFSLRSYLDLK